MTKDILENAKFGDRFITRDGSIVRYITSDSDEILFNENTNDICQYYPDGNIFGSNNEDCNYPHDIEHKWDIISRYQEEIDEDWMIEKGAYKCPKDSKNPQEWIKGFVEGIQYSLNHQFTNKKET